MIEKNRALAVRWMDEVWNQRREATVEELLHAEAVAHMEGAEVRGISEFKSVRAALLAGFPDIHLTIEDTVAEGNQVAVRWQVTGTHRGEWLGLAPTQRTVAFRGVSWLRFEGDQIREGWDSWNLGALLQILQVVGP